MAGSCVRAGRRGAENLIRHCGDLVMTQIKSNGGKAQTVTGLRDPDQLGITLPHEHLIVDNRVWWTGEPDEPDSRRLAHEPVDVRNLSWLQHNTFASLDNLQLSDEDCAIAEAMLFKEEGGNTILDVTTQGMGRNPQALARISKLTGLNIVAGSGYYVGSAQGKDSDLGRKGEEEICREIVSDIQKGIDGSEICAGIIGEVGCSWPLQIMEKKSLRASALAQKETGAAISVHAGRHVNAPMEILKHLDRAGADLTRVVIGHIDRMIHPLNIRRDVAETGCYLEYDMFGSQVFQHSRGELAKIARLCDRERVEQIIELIDSGYLNQILISHDICYKIKLIRYGGHGYAHILRNILPQMVVRGITRDQIHTIMVENPKRLLTLVCKD
jgi:phosphotriesterase-related protein